MDLNLVESEGKVIKKNLEVAGSTTPLENDHLRVLRENWLDHLRARRRSENTVRAYDQAVRRWAESVRYAEPAGASLNDLDLYMRDLAREGYSEHTRRLVRAAFRSFFAYVCDYAELRPSSPAERLEAPPPPYAEQPRILSARDVQRLIWGDHRGFLDPRPLAGRDQALVAVSYICGLRVSEPGKLRVADLDHDGRCWSILIRLGKRARADVRRPIIDDEISNLFGAYVARRYERWGESPWVFPSRSGRALSKRDAARAFKRRLEAAGFRREFTFHDLRRGLSTHLEAAGVGAKRNAEWLRHRNAATTLNHYAHTQGGRLKSPLSRSSTPTRFHPIPGQSGHFD